MSALNMYLAYSAGCLSTTLVTFLGFRLRTAWLVRKRRSAGNQQADRLLGGTFPSNLQRTVILAAIDAFTAAQVKAWLRVNYQVSGLLDLSPSAQLDVIHRLKRAVVAAVRADIMQPGVIGSGTLSLFDLDRASEASPLR